MRLARKLGALAFSAETSTVVEARGLSKSYPNGVQGLRDLNVVVKAGELVGLLGRSGSGKTTLFRLLVGTIRPSAGELRVLGTDMTRVRSGDLRGLRRRMAWVSQQHNLVPGLSVGHNVLLAKLGRQPLWRIMSRLLRLPMEERRDAFGALNVLGVGEKLYERADDLSGGQQQRVAVARALLSQPDLLLADEPVASVDSRTAEDVLRAFVQLNHEHGTTALVSLHQPELALAFCPRIIVLGDGTVIYDGPADGIDRTRLYAYADDYTGKDEPDAQRLQHAAPPCL
jgi:phosphonate transport system ATP-binding protein